MPESEHVPTNATVPGFGAAVTWPVAMSMAANRVVVPCRFRGNFYSVPPGVGRHDLRTDSRSAVRIRHRCRRRPDPEGN